MVKKLATAILLSSLLFGCSAEDPPGQKEVESSSVEKTKEITKEEKNAYVNELLDVNMIWISVLEDFESFIQGRSPYEVKRYPALMDELEAIMARIEDEMVPAFDTLGFPPSKDLEPLYKVESDYVNEAEEIARLLPEAVSGDANMKAQLKERLSHMKEMSSEISDIVSSLELK
ncbi:hypothetical protein AWM68_17300 [Fictibacillus phosphorivorans]|uniref:Uncharacterized protein n=1 Tax=Fictibacillus phosphorivorans TaxID=1221500 RepID=A0A165NW78_9BACL|nr:hypothetical protein [Fictibacillus phosphorivorans]KZE67930.1 hypothetical protein AWM68_17300 [Fictibacillus phosphorivorans]